MKNIADKFLLISIILLACQNKEPAPNRESNSPGNQTTNENPAGYSQDVAPKIQPVPDTASYFPLLEGSYWIYESVMEGEKQEGSRRVDSVISIALLGKGYLVKVVEKGADGDSFEIQYRVDKEGRVWIGRGQNQTFEPFASLNPDRGETVGGRTYYPCRESEPEIPDCFLLQPYPGELESLTEEQRMEWNGFFFKKGIGLEAQAGADISTELIEYRIGLNGSVIRTGR